MPDETKADSNVSGSGQSVSIIIGDKLGRWIIAALVALIVMMFLTDRTASKAELKSNQAVKAAEDLQTEYRVTQLWAQKVATSCESHGVSIASFPNR